MLPIFTLPFLLTELERKKGGKEEEKEKGKEREYLCYVRVLYHRKWVGQRFTELV